jgi:hypothetical protein
MTFVWGSTLLDLLARLDAAAAGQTNVHQDDVGRASSCAIATASSWVEASPTTVNVGWRSSKARMPSRTTSWSSTINSRNIWVISS